MPRSLTRQLVSFVRAFGTVAGIRIWCSLLIQSHLLLRRTFGVRLPGMAAPIYLRRQDLPIFWQIMVMREYDLQSIPQARRLMAAYEALQSEGKKPIIVDCGGHVGLSAVWFANRFPDALVYVIEPERSNFQLLQRNTAAYRQVIPLHGGVWGQPCRLVISNPSAGNASFLLREVPESAAASGSDSLRGYSIEGLSPPPDLSGLFVVKIDIEGAEAELFQGSAEWLRIVKLVIIELHDWLLPWQGTSRNFFKRIAEHNFDVVVRGENLLLFQP